MRQIISRLRIWAAQWTFVKRHIIAGDNPAGPLLIRYILVKGPWFGVCIHKLCRSDVDRALHDHPWAFISVILRGGYREVVDINELLDTWCATVAIP